MRSRLVLVQNPENHVKTRIQKTLDKITDSAVLAMALEEMEFLGLIKWKPDADKRLAIDDKDSRASFAERRVA
jgi:hypothetical protein